MTSLNERIQRWPSSDVYLLTLGESVILEQRLDVFPARQAADLSNIRNVNDFCKAAARCISKDSPFHMRGLHLTPGHSKLPGVVNESLGDVDRVAISLRETERDIDLVFGSGFTDLFHLGAFNLERVLDIFDIEVEVYGSTPAEMLVQDRCAPFFSSFVPDPGWVPRNPNFRESNKLCFSFGSFLDDLDRFGYRALQI